MVATNSDRDTGAPPAMQVTSLDGGVFDAAVAMPAAPNGCAVVVVQEIFGVTRKIRGYGTLLATHGYAAIAPDLFWRMERRVELAHDDADMKRALDYLRRFDEAAGLDDIGACVAHLRKQGYRRVAVMGFCLGGKLAALSAARGDADVAVSFYGVGLEQRLAPLRALARPLQLHFGAQDAYVPAAAIASIESALAAAPAVELHVYPEAGHAFFRPDLKGSASAVAWERTLAFLAKHLA